MVNENDLRLLEVLKTSTKQVSKIAALEAREREAYKKQVADLFFELQKAVHLIVSEEYLILNSFEWNSHSSYATPPNLESDAKLFAKQHGFNEDTVLELYKLKNYGHENAWEYLREKQ